MMPIKVGMCHPGQLLCSEDLFSNKIFISLENSFRSNSTAVLVDCQVARAVILE